MMFVRTINTLQYYVLCNARPMFIIHQGTITLISTQEKVIPVPGELCTNLKLRYVNTSGNLRLRVGCYFAVIISLIFYVSQQKPKRANFLRKWEVQ